MGLSLWPGGADGREEAELLPPFLPLPCALVDMLEVLLLLVLLLSSVKRTPSDDLLPFYFNT